MTTVDRFREQGVGWANADVLEGRLKVEVGYALGRPRDNAYRREVGNEVAGLAEFLGLEQSEWKETSG